MEMPTIYKQVRLGNFDHKPFNNMGSVMEDMKRTEKNIFDRYIINVQLEALKVLPRLVQGAVCFNLEKIKHIICPDEISHNVFKQDVHVPYHTLWLENHTKTLDRTQEDEVQWFSLFAKDLFKTDIDFIRDVALTVKRQGHAFTMPIENKTIGNYTVFMGGKFKDTVVFPYCIVTWFEIDNRFLQSDKGVLFFCPMQELFGNIPKDNFSSDAASLARFCNFLEIKNIRVKSEKMPLTQKQIRQNNIRHGIEYKTIVVTKPGKQYIGKGRSDNPAHFMPLHLCRGHVREYGAEKPLFGKYTGRFFIHEHLRGNAEYGEIQKTYQAKGV